MSSVSSLAAVLVSLVHPSTDLRRLAPSSLEQRALDPANLHPGALHLLGTHDHANPGSVGKGRWTVPRGVRIGPVRNVAWSRLTAAT